jgi:hypothetical protein
MSGSFRGGNGIVIGTGGLGTDESVPECPVCWALLGGDHGGYCPNARKALQDWETEAPPGFEKPGRRTDADGSGQGGPGLDSGER